MPANSIKKPIIEVISSSKLNDSQKEKIKSSALKVFELEAATYKFSEDRSMIAGLMIRYGSRVCDMSVKGEINSL